MKFLISIFLIALLSFGLGLYLPWWTVAAASFVVILFIPQKPGTSFLAGFLAIFIFWGLMSFIISNANHHILANKISPVIIKTVNPYLLILATAMIGGLVAGLAALAASFARRSQA